MLVAPQASFQNGFPSKKERPRFKMASLLKRKGRFKRVVLGLRRVLQLQTLRQSRKTVHIPVRESQRKKNKQKPDKQNIGTWNYFL